MAGSMKRVQDGKGREERCQKPHGAVRDLAEHGAIEAKNESTAKENVVAAVQESLE